MELSETNPTPPLDRCTALDRAMLVILAVVGTYLLVTSANSTTGSGRSAHTRAR